MRQGESGNDPSSTYNLVVGIFIVLLVTIFGSPTIYLSYQYVYLSAYGYQDNIALVISNMFSDQNPLDFVHMILIAIISGTSAVVYRLPFKSVWNLLLVLYIFLIWLACIVTGGTLSTIEVEESLRSVLIPVEPLQVLVAKTRDSLAIYIAVLVGLSGKEQFKSKSTS